MVEDARKYVNSGSGTNKPSSGTNKPVQDSSNAQTGDEVMLFVMLMLVSLMGLGAATILRKKEEI